MFWGDRVGKLKDPYGHCWVIATHKQDLTDKELEAAQKQWLAHAARSRRPPSDVTLPTRLQIEWFQSVNHPQACRKRLISFHRGSQ